MLNSYRGFIDERYWETSRGIKSCINPGKLKQMAIDTGFLDMDLLQEVLRNLE